MTFVFFVSVTGCLYILNFVLGTTESSVSQEYELLPRIFYVNETEICPDVNLYCKVDLRLKPKNLDNPPKLWELIEKKSVYKRSCIYRAFCIGEENFEAKIEQELYDYNLTGDIIQSFCYRKQTFTDGLGPLNIVVGVLIMSYIGFMTYSTIKTLNPKNNTNKYQKMFSVVNIWREINRTSRNEDFNNLLSIQGMRTLAMIFIVGIHSIFTIMVLKFIRNPEYFEDVPHNLAKSIFYGSFGLTVQIYFIISAWLLSVQLHNIVEKNGEFTWKDLFLLWLNRYLRLFPTILMTILMHSSDTTAILLTHPYFYSITRREVERCKTIWWKNLLFMQNLNVAENEICSPGMWYLAADFQMYLIVSVFFYLSRRFKISLTYFFGLIASISVSIQIFNVFTTDFDGLLHFNPRLLPPENFISNPENVISYIKTYGSAVTYIIGFVFGTIYWKNKNQKIFDTMTKNLFLYGAFLGSPILTCYLYEIRSNRLVEAIQSVTLRPLFSLGIAIGLLGMATGSGGYIKRFLESGFMVFFANFTYSTYLFHFVLVFGRSMFKIEYVEVNDFYCFSNWMIDVIISFALGMVMYIILEHPCLRLQKTYIPQISTGKRKE